MKKTIFFIVIFPLFWLSCLEPGRDNPYDPKNSDSGILALWVRARDPGSQVSAHFDDIAIWP